MLMFAGGEQSWAACELNPRFQSCFMNKQEAIRHACEIAGHTMSYAVELDAAGMTERELADRIDDKMRELGAEENAFPTIVGVGENGAEIHHEPGDRTICENEPVVIDLGCRVEGYCSDMTRTVVFGDEPTEKFREVYAIVEEAQRRAISALEAGVNGGDIDAVARGYIKDRGYGDNFVHSTGHGLGKEVHEHPKIAPDSEDVLEEGDIVTIEPGVYIEGEFGVRIEDSLSVNGSGAVILSGVSG